MIKKYVIACLLVGYLLVATEIQAQNSKITWGFGWTFNDFKTPVSDNTSDLFKVKQWNSEAFHVNLGGSISPSFVLLGQLMAGHLQLGEDKFPHSYTKRSYWNFSAEGQYHFANGKILSADAKIAPYFFLRYGITHMPNTKEYISLAPGVGVNFWIAPDFAVTLNTSFVAQNVYEDYLQHNLGLRFRVKADYGKPKDSDGDGVADKEDGCPDQAGTLATGGCPDQDGDGIADKDDACATASGSKELGGCPDSDKDGVADKDDTCPDKAGKAEFGGCPDTDGDGIADKDDTCPDKAGKSEFGGCPDTDGDGIADKDDKCPNQAGTKTTSGCPDKDGDGVTDSNDKCPDVPGLVSKKGCPEVKKEEAAEVEKELQIAAKQIQFNAGSDVLAQSSYAELDEILKVLNKYPGSKFDIEGHTDSSGDAAKNKELSQKRADAVKKYFTDKGIEEDRLVAVGFGPDKPLVPNTTATNRAKNRRVEIHLMD